ncbi:MAG: HlyC/CorC family transporter [Planctomycetes bacterium]|nr:HlyC/CorC family transporter [Planctomycetota bacterium]
MTDWVTWVGAFDVAVLTLFATLNLALRLPSHVRIAEQFDKVGRRDAFEAFVTARPRYLLATAVIRSVATLAMLLLALFSWRAGSADPGSISLAVTCGVTLVLVLVFGVAIPNAWAKYAGDALIVRTLPLLSSIRVLCLPLIAFLEIFDPLVRRLAGVPVRDAKSHADELERQILDAVREGEKHGAVDEEEKEMIESVIELTDTHVEEIMTPRTDVVGIPIDADYEAVLATIRKKGHSRIPVYEDTIDTILGVLYAKDLLQRKSDEPFSLSSSMRKALFIPERKMVRELLREFQSQKVHIAIVLDEYGGTAGLVTIEDILEELVGEIHDEYDETTAVELVRIDERTVEVDARMRVDELNDELDVALPEDEDYETIGGFVCSRMGKIPKVGEQIEHNGMVIRVIDAEPRRVIRVRLEMSIPSETDEAPA